MPFRHDDFFKLRPFVHHLTAASNLPVLLAIGELRSAEALMKAAGQEALVRQRRKTGRHVEIGRARVHIRDQSPLHRGNVKLEDGWSFEDVVALLNRHTFFWPGKEDLPIPAGRKHFARYKGEDAVVLRVRTAALIEANAGAAPLFCRYNSGAPRCSRGRPSPRGSRTFLPAQDFPDPQGEVQELVFPHRARLPVAELQFRRLAEAKWQTVDTDTPLPPA